MHSHEPYEPIDCSVHDRFEAAAVRRERVRIDWTDSDETHTAEGTIRDILVRDGAEFLVMSDGAEIRLDRITGFSTLP